MSSACWPSEVWEGRNVSLFYFYFLKEVGCLWEKTQKRLSAALILSSLSMMRARIPKAVPSMYVSSFSPSQWNHEVEVMVISVTDEETEALRGAVMDPRPHS